MNNKEIYSILLEIKTKMINIHKQLEDNRKINGGEV